MRIIMNKKSFKNDKTQTVNSVEDEGGKAVGDLLKTNTTITELDLTCNAWKEIIN